MLAYGAVAADEDKQLNLFYWIHIGAALAAFRPIKQARLRQ